MLEKFAGEAAWQMVNQPQELVDPPAQIDKAGEFQTKWGTATGQLWQIDMHRLLCGDSTKARGRCEVDEWRAGRSVRDGPALRGRLHGWLSPAKLGK